MSRFFVILKRPLLALVLFLLFQAMGGVFVLIVQMFSGEGSLLENVSDRLFDPRLMGMATFISNIAIAIACLASPSRNIK